MSVVIEGLGEDRALRTLIAGKVTNTLERLQVAATGVRVQFSDENGSKGGIDIRCSLTIDVPHRPELHADTVAADARLAFEQAFAAVERPIEPGSGSVGTGSGVLRREAGGRQRCASACWACSMSSGPEGPVPLGP